MSDAYAQAGVNIEAGNETVRRIKDKVKKTFSSHVLTGIGSFGALYDIKSALEPYHHPVLVQSIDGVGTKLSVARMMAKYDTVGMDIVNHCCNDILAMGARPLTFLDYVANEKLDPQVVEDIVAGMAESCSQNGVSLIGGETAEMPGTYAPGEHDIAGCITGVVEKDKIITGETIVPGDIVIGFASNGLHTNGYSLARKILFADGGLAVTDRPEGLSESLGLTLLKPHTNYVLPVMHMLDAGINIKGIAHITGGGFIDNIPRVLPENCNAEIQKSSWPVLSIFNILEKMGAVDQYTMYRTFNMGIGLVLVVSAGDEEKMRSSLSNFPQFPLYRLGKIVTGEQKVILTE